MQDNLFEEWHALGADERCDRLKERILGADALTLALLAVRATNLRTVLAKLDTLAHYVDG